MPEITTLYRHPVKGLSPQEISEAQLEIDGHFPCDRLFALENGPSGFDAAAPEHLPKFKFLMLMRNERLARLKTTYDPATHILAIRQGGNIAAAGDIRTKDGRGAIERFFEHFMGDALRGPIRLLDAPEGYRFMDSRSGFVSILNQKTISAIAAMLGRERLDTRRFRGNVLIAGMEAFTENDLVGRKISLGTAELEITKRIERCAATDVDPTAGIRDTGMVAALERAYGHHDCGIYARIVKAGAIRIGDRLRVID
jgi:uncharacterized protein YcbX